MTPQVKAAKDFDNTLSTKKRSPAPQQEPQHLPPPPPAPRLSLPALGSFTSPSPSPSTPTPSPSTPTPSPPSSSQEATSSSDYDDSYTAFYSSIPTVADSLYTAITPPATTSTTTTNNNKNSNNPYRYHSYSTTFSGSAEYQYHASLGSRTPMQVVAISNHKLNSDIFSSRSLSIHRRILVKNLLTLIYEMNPMLDWFDDASGLDVGMYDDDEEDDHDDSIIYAEPLLAEDEQNGWIEQTLSAAGLSDEDDEDEYDDCDSALAFDRMSKSRDFGSPPAKATPTNNNATQQQPQPKKKSKKASKSDKKDSAAAMVDKSTPSNNVKPRNTYTLSPPSSSSSASSTTSSSSSGSSGSSVSFSTIASLPKPVKSPLPRPKSIELPQSLNNYLSTVFDVDWSVELPTMEDSLFTFGGSSSTSSSGSSSFLGTSPPKTTYLNGSLLSSSPKRRSLSSTTSTISSSSFSSLSKDSTSATSSSSSLSSVDSSTKSPPLPATQTTAGAATPRGATTSSSEIMVAQAVVRPYQGNSNNTSAAVNRGTGSVVGISSAGPKSLPPLRQDTQQHAAGPGSIPIKGGAIPRAGDGQNTPKINNPPINNNSNNNRIPASNAPTGTSPPKPVTRKTTLVPGRRSSLLHTGQMPSSVSNPRKSPSNGPDVVVTNSNDSMTIGPTSNAIGSSNGGGSTLTRTSPPSPPVNTSFTNGYLSAGNSANHDGRNSGSGSGSGSGAPGFAQRTSSLLPMERPAPVQRNPSSDNVASSAGLPRPLLAKSFSSPIFIGSVPAANSSSPALSHSHSYPSSSSLTGSSGAGSGKQYYDHNQGNSDSNGYNPAAAEGFPVVRSRSPPPPHAPRKVIMMPPLTTPPPSTSSPSGPSGPSSFGFAQQHAPSALPPWSPSRSASVSSYILTPAPPSAPVTKCFGSSTSRAPVLPPLFPIQKQNQDQKNHGPHRSPPMSPTGGSVSYPYQPQPQPQQHQKQQQQHLTAPITYNRSTSADQIHARSTPPSPPPSSTSPSPTGSSSSSSSISSAASLPLANHHHSSSSMAKRTVASYGMKASKSSPDLTTRGAGGGGSNSDIYHLGGSTTASQERLVGANGRPSPSLPAHYQNYSQKSFTYKVASPPQHGLHGHGQRQQSYSYDGSGSGVRDGKAAGINSAPIPRVAMTTPPSGPSPNQVGGGSGSGNRWATMKTMFSLKTTTGHGGK
ncbi:hypothetical protein BGW39_010155 [Mortierella sp. 14UC]|nr:hypothetical protein BGW39_010155 [Mortierella sp. 14UC]